MNVRNIGTIMRMVIVIGGILGFVLVTIARADDVYNFYFQKGGAPQNVIQSGGGQTTSAKSSPSPEASPTATPNAPPTQNSAPASKDASAGSISSIPPPTETSGQRPFTISLGYGKSSDSLGTNPAYSFGFQYNFNRFIGTRLQGRFRDTQSGTNYQNNLSNPNSAANKVGGMGALVFTPLRLDLVGHRFVELSAYAGAETYRRITGYSSGADIATGYSPMIGASALLCLNDNVGIEVQGNRNAAKSTYIGANLAFQF